MCVIMFSLLILNLRSVSCQHVTIQRFLPRNLASKSRNPVRWNIMKHSNYVLEISLSEALSSADNTVFLADILNLQSVYS